MEAITVKNLKRHYKIYQKSPGVSGTIKSVFKRETEIIKAVDDISFSINEGELVGFIGPNGAGKTTTLKCLSGLLFPTSGQVSVLGYEPFKRNHDFLKKISLVMGQKNQLWWDLPAMESFLLAKEIYEIEDSKFKKTLSDLVDLLEAKEFLNVPVKKLSLGQRMKSELIAALIHNPKVLFLDEPTIGLDVVMQKKVRDFIRDYNRSFKATIILTSHYMTDVEELSSRVIIINHGKILFDDKITTLVRDFSPFKLVRINLKNVKDFEKVNKLAQVIDYSFPQLTLRIPANEIAKITAKILEEVEIFDISIQDPEMEDIVREYFTAKKK